MYTSVVLKERIRQLARCKKMTIKQLLISCDLNENTMNQISDKKGLSSFSLAKIADALDCSVDYLLGRTDTPKPNEISAHIDQAHSSFVQSENAPVVMVAPSSGGQPDDLRQELMQCFDRLSFKDKVEIMRMIAEKAG